MFGRCAITKPVGELARRSFNTLPNLSEKRRVVTKSMVACHLLFLAHMKPMKWQWPINIDIINYFCFVNIDLNSLNISDQTDAK